MHFSSILSPLAVKHFIFEYMKVEMSNFDYGSFIFGEENSEATIIFGESGILAGTPFIDALFKEVGCSVTWLFKEGESIKGVSTQVATIKGHTKEIFRVEQLTLSILARASGLATVAKRMSDKLDAVKWKGKLVTTRKTTPGFHLVERYALLVGSTGSHMYDNSSVILLRDNQIKASGGVTKAVESSRKVGGTSVKIEVACHSQTEAEEAAKAGADIVMLHKMDSKQVNLLSKSLKIKFPNVQVEVSGGINESNVTSFALPSVDMISCSGHCQAYKPLNITIDVAPEPTPILKMENATPSTPAATPVTTTPAVTPKGTPAVTPKSTPGVTPKVTPTVTPKVTPQAVKRPAGATGTGPSTTPNSQTTGKQDSQANKRPRVETSPVVKPVTTPVNKPKITTPSPIRAKFTSSNGSANRPNQQSAGRGQMNRPMGGARPSFQSPIRTLTPQHQVKPSNQGQRPGGMGRGNSDVGGIVRMVAANLGITLPGGQPRPQGVMISTGQGHRLINASAPQGGGGGMRPPMARPGMGQPQQRMMTQVMMRPPMGGGGGGSFPCRSCGAPNANGSQACRNCRKNFF